MRSLDEFYRYIEKQEQALLRSSVAAPMHDGEAAAAEAPPADTEAGFEVAQDAPEQAQGSADEDAPPRVSPLVAVPVAVPPRRRVRYILRGGMTVAVPVEEDEPEPQQAGGDDTTAAVAAARRRAAGAAVTGNLDAPSPQPPSPVNGQQAAPPDYLPPDYLPPLVEGQEPTLVADTPARPRKNGVGPWHRSARADEAEASEAPLSDGDAAALWQRIPRHIRILVSMEEPQEEVAQKYYARGFKESRRQLIERLLDPTLTLEDTARVLGVCPTTVRRYTNRGLLPHHRTVGQQRRFRLSDVLAFMEQQQKRGMRDEG